MGDSGNSGKPSANWNTDFNPFKSPIWGGNKDTSNKTGGMGNTTERYKEVTGQPSTQQIKDQSNAIQQQNQQNAQNKFALDEQEKARQAHDAANKTYQDQQAGLTKSLDDENAFNAARNARRKATGQTLFGGWNG